ncbi:MAG: hypothetical protein COT74_09945 [Bdellovibrionales bacterium CG10_big_fil_rev_8_21_14_0_10_45_34]|nr:MAG: hypothetical protein COT74_09945 [Bdellovibrionales bacterium CG10_big_fil_rev_8_21_14_0_10_45_34]
MSSKALAPKDVSNQAVILIGVDQGKVFDLKEGLNFAGRSLDNDIVINDPKTSRKHFVLNVSVGQVHFKNLSPQNEILINGKFLLEGRLEPGTLILLGDTQIKIQTSNLMKAIPFGGLPVEKPKNQRVSLSTPPKQVSKQSPANPIKYAIYAAILIGVGYLVLNSPSTIPQTSNPGAETEAISPSEDASSTLLRELSASGKDTQNYTEAQAAFIRGFRDYREGNYRRAADSFGAALSLYPTHQLAQKYLALAQRKHDELIQNTMVEARRLFEQGSLRKSQAKYKLVVILLQDPNHSLYKEAHDKFNEIELLLKSEF